MGATRYSAYRPGWEKYKEEQAFPPPDQVTKGIRRDPERLGVTGQSGPCIVVEVGNFRGFRRWLLLGVLLCGIGSLAAETGVQEIAQRVDAHYDNLHSLQAEFTETYRGAGIQRVEAGTLWLKRPGRMRWEYRQPREKLFLSDGKTAWFYVPGEKQARRAPLKKLDDLHSPLAYLLGRVRLEKEFAGLSLAPDVKPEAAGNVVIRGVPRRVGGIVQVLMEVAPDGRFTRILVAQEDGSTTDLHFAGQRENQAIPDQRFRFSPPPGIETIEAEQLGQ